MRWSALLVIGIGPAFAEDTAVTLNPERGSVIAAAQTPLIKRGLPRKSGGHYVDAHCTHQGILWSGVT